MGSGRAKEYAAPKHENEGLEKKVERVVDATVRDGD